MSTRTEHSAVWEPALVAVDEFLGPYPTLVLVDRDPVVPLRPKAATRALAGGNGHVVQIVDGLVVHTAIVFGQTQPSEVISADADGLYVIEATVGQWALVETP